MLNLRSVFFLCCLHAGFASQLHAQYTTNIDSTVSAYLDRVTYWGEVFKTPSDYNDSLIAANDTLINYMKQVCSDPATITARFERAQASGLIITGNDSNLRFYSWDTWMDPVMHCFGALAQYRTSNGVKLNVLNSVSNLYKRGDPGSYYSDMVTVHTKEGTPVYLVTDCSIAGDIKGYEIKAWAIEQDTLTPVYFFRKGNVVTRSVDYAYREHYTGDTTGRRTGQFNNLHFSADRSRIYLPIISPTGSISDLYYIYRFEGDMYVYKRKGEDKHEDGGK